MALSSSRGMQLLSDSARGHVRHSILDTMGICDADVERGDALSPTSSEGLLASMTPIEMAIAEAFGAVLTASDATRSHPSPLCELQQACRLRREHPQKLQHLSQPSTPAQLQTQPVEEEQRRVEVELSPTGLRQSILEMHGMHEGESRESHHSLDSDRQGPANMLEVAIAEAFGAALDAVQLQRISDRPTPRSGPSVMGLLDALKEAAEAQNGPNRARLLDAMMSHTSGRSSLSASQAVPTREGAPSSSASATTVPTALEDVDVADSLQQVMESVGVSRTELSKVIAHMEGDEIEVPDLLRVVSDAALRPAVEVAVLRAFGAAMQQAGVAASRVSSIDGSALPRLVSPRTLMCPSSLRVSGWVAADWRQTTLLACGSALLVPCSNPPCFAPSCDVTGSSSTTSIASSSSRVQSPTVLVQGSTEAQGVVGATRAAPLATVPASSHRRPQSPHSQRPRSQSRASRDHPQK